MKTSLAFLVLACALQNQKTIAKNVTDLGTFARNVYNFERHTSPHTKATHGDVRLVNGLTSSSGRVEVYYQGSWGSVCDDGFNAGAAQVTCRNAGFSDARPIRFNSRYLGAPATGRILLDDVRCVGNESNILHCGHRTIGFNDCDHEEDVGVDCYGQDIGRAGELRNGTSTDGVLVLLYGGIAGTVCFDSGWGNPESRVACRMVGYEQSGIAPMAVNRSFFGQSTDMPVLMSRVQCRGNESDLSRCQHRGMGSSSCTDNRAIGIDCLGGSNLEVTLANGNETYGQIQFSYYLASGPLCGYDINPMNMKVYCRMLGYSRHYGVSMGVTKQNGTTGFVYSILCDGTEKSILECNHRNPLLVGECDVSPTVACLPQDDIAVRLTSGNSTFGKLEVQYKGRWGSVCDDSFSRNAAKVFCRMLNQPSENAMAFRRQSQPIYPSTQSEPILLDDVRCSGTEAHVNECYHHAFGVHNCMHNEDVWINCQ